MKTLLATPEPDPGRQHGITVALAAQPTDADLLSATASLMNAMPGPRLPLQLSDLLRYVCSISAPDGRDRAARLVEKLTEHLVDGMALRPEEASWAGLDAWAAKMTLPSVRVRLVGCARRHRAER